MKKILLVGLTIMSFNAQAFLDFNSYGDDYKNNDWPVWTPMFWMDKAKNNSPFSDNKNTQYGYPYNNRPYNVGASQFNMANMPTPNQAFQAESQQAPSPIYMTPAAMSFSNLNNKASSPVRNLSGPYPSNYNFSEPRNPYGNGF
jgi:hypothetical protein